MPPIPTLKDGIGSSSADTGARDRAILTWVRQGDIDVDATDVMRTMQMA